MEPVTRVGVELLEKLKRKADKYWMSPQQRVYRANKVSCWGLEQTGARRNTAQQFQPYPLQYSADSAILCKYSAILCNNTVRQSANTV